VSASLRTQTRRWGSAIFMSKPTHVWFWKTRLPERKGQSCCVLARGKLNSCLVQFADGVKIVTSRYAVRKITP
jgi:hypothetical protein